VVDQVLLPQVAYFQVVQKHPELAEMEASEALAAVVLLVGLVEAFEDVGGMVGE
jgi:hypothetical protein